ncbi:PilZ-like domain-containing protein [Geomonas subterranea]|uniref:PilZ-like domain-containing protein n=1 Tax=Geomonas subterranea TaxID=2847989 RepID=UPI001CD1F538|nr:PilZ-like domain-containing protein [Geomonas fuzhouensis]
MEDDYTEYREALAPGMRIQIGIPLSGGGVFRDWGVISESGGDELQVQISRDVLPANVRVDVGFILDVSVRLGKDSYTCSGIVTDRLGSRVLLIRLFGRFTLSERRQFFRADMALKVRYDIVDESSRREVEQDWEVRKEREQMKFQGYDDFVIAAQMARFQPAKPIAWQDLLRAQLNLGGGGICLRMPTTARPDQLVNLELYLPLTPPRLVHAVGQVIHIKPPLPQRDGSSRYDVGMEFLLLDERDRDLIFRQISAVQISHLRKVADKRDVDELEEAPPAPLTRKQIATRAAWTLLFLFFAFLLGRYLITYSQAPPENEIQKTYEQSIRKYRHLDKNP